MTRFDANLGWLFTEHPFEQRFEAAAAAGFTAVEYAAPYPYLPSQLTKWLADAGLTQVLINTPLPCLPGPPTDFREGVEQGLEYAVELGCQILHLVGGTKPEDMSHERAFAQYVVDVAWAAERAKGTDVRLVLEAQNTRDKPGFIVDEQARAAAVVQAVAADNVGLLFDIYHAQLSEDDLEATLIEFLPLTFHVQIADPPARTEPGTGDVPWSQVFDILDSYDGWIGCEYRPASTTVAGLGWLKEFTR